MEENTEKEPETIEKQEDAISFNKNTLWKVGTFVLGILFVISLFTGGFGIKNITGSAAINTDKVVVTIVNDERCEECDVSFLKSRLEELFDNVEIEEFDYDSKKGKELFEDNNLEFLPAVLFTEDVKDTSAYSDLSSYLIEAGDFLSLAVGAGFDPTAEICDNKKDDDGNGKVDCDDAGCENKLVCNEDALADCAREKGTTPDTVIFYYSDSCGWCQKMKPGVEKLEEEGYKVKWVEAGSAEDTNFVEKCFGDYMGSGVPQFICPKTAEIKSGAFVDGDSNLDTDAMRDWMDKCK